MQPDEPIEHELLRNAVAAEVTVTSTEVSPTSTGDRYVRIEGRLGDDEESHAEWAALGFIYALGVLSFAAARPRGVSGIDFETAPPSSPRPARWGCSRRRSNLVAPPCS